MANSPYGFLSYWFKGFSDLDAFAILCVTAPNDIPTVNIAHEKIENKIYLHITLTDDSTFEWIDAITQVELPNDAAWHSVMISWDTSSALIRCAVDNALVSLDVQSATFDSFDVGYYDDGNIVIGYSVSGSPSGSLAEFFFLIPTSYQDVGDAAVRNKFVTDAGFATDIGGNGKIPFDELPNIYLFGNSDTFKENIARDTFTLLSRTPATNRSLTLGPDAIVVTASDDPRPPSLPGIEPFVAIARADSQPANPRGASAPAQPRTA